MTEPTTNEGSSGAHDTPGKGLNIALWVVQVLLALAFLGAASGKLTGKPEMIATFEKIGLGQWFRYLTGVLEVLGGLLLVLPGAAAFGALLLVCVMIGAVAAHLFVLGGSPLAAIVLGALSAFVLWGRRARLLALVGK